jgi:hypothetical protein
MQMFGESLSIIRSVPEDQVVGGYKDVHHRADCVLYMVANLQLKCLDRYGPLGTNESRMLTIRRTTRVHSLCETVDTASR